MAESQRIVFMGTPAFGAIVLKALIDAKHEIAGVYTQPDRPAGRGMKAHPSEVKQLAERVGLPVFQPASLRSQDEIALLGQLEPDYLIVAAYGLLLPQQVVDLPRIAPINVHASLLPRYRGAAPVQRAIQENWGPGAKTGASIMRIVRELDAGPVYAETEVAIDHLDSAALGHKLANAGADLLLDILPAITARILIPVPQDDTLATYAPKLVKADGVIDWHKTALEVDALIRAMNPWPGGQTTFEFENRIMPILIRSGRPTLKKVEHEAGRILCARAGLSVACADCWYEIDRLQPQGRKEMSSREFANGQRIPEGIAGQCG